jgi:predicted ABC-type ATPase
LNLPTFTVVAGANGCGKSTLTRWAKAFFQQSPLLDPDAIAVELQAESNIKLSDIEAGKEVIRSAESFLNVGVVVRIKRGADRIRSRRRQFRPRIAQIPNFLRRLAD